jgi:hypothetical protein
MADPLLGTLLWIFSTPFTMFFITMALSIVSVAIGLFAGFIVGTVAYIIALAGSPDIVQLIQIVFTFSWGSLLILWFFILLGVLGGMLIKKLIFQRYLHIQI